MNLGAFRHSEHSIQEPENILVRIHCTATDKMKFAIKLLLGFKWAQASKPGLSCLIELLDQVSLLPGAKKFLYRENHIPLNTMDVQEDGQE